MLQICSIASGSSGNCIYIGTESTHMLIDVGISGKKAEEGLESLGLSFADLDGVLITHEHSDHIKGLGVLERKSPIPMYMTEGTKKQLQEMPQLGNIDWEACHLITAGKEFSIGEIKIMPILVSHDAAEPVACRIQSADKKLAVITDLGYYTPEIADKLKGLDLILLESNYDMGMLQAGRYPYPLKRRIAGEKGHLSNEEAGRLINDIWHPGLRYVILGHLSRENNFPQLAYETVRSEILLGDYPDGLSQLTIKVAKREEISQLIQL